MPDSDPASPSENQRCKFMKETPPALLFADSVGMPASPTQKVVLAHRSALLNVGVRGDRFFKCFAFLKIPLAFLCVRSLS